MIPIATEIEYQGRTLRQIQRTAGAAIYELRGAGDALYGYEVICIAVLPKSEMESYPCSSDWGSAAWSYGCNNLAEAMTRFNGLDHSTLKAA